MKILIVGCGKVGCKLAEQLQIENNDITVIDEVRQTVEMVTNQCDVMGIVGNGSDVEVLKHAGIEDADLLIAVTHSDELNLICCLIARKVGSCQTIARVRNPQYSSQISLIKEDLGLAMVINPEQAAADEIARVLKFPSAIRIDTFAKGKAELLSFRIPDTSEFDNITVMELCSSMNGDILICGIQRGEEIFIPDGGFEIKKKDIITFVSSPQNAERLFKTIKIKSNRVKDVLIVGGGEIAYYLAKRLINVGVHVKIIEKNPERCGALCDLLPEADIINGDGTDNQLLLEEGLEYASAFAALTNMDEENILLSLFAKSKSDAKLVTKINRIAYDEVISNLDLDTTIYPKNITSEIIIRFVRAKNKSIGSNIETMHRIMAGKAEALEFIVNEHSNVTGVSLEKLKLKKGLLVACITRGDKLIIPKGSDEILPGDAVVVVTADTGYKDISDILA